MKNLKYLNKYRVELFKNVLGDEHNGAFFEINYCPMCGRRLG